MILSSGSFAVDSEVILGLGSNMGDRMAYLSYTVRQLNEEAGKITAVSSVWETEPWGFEAEERFLNMVVALTTTFEPKKLLTVIRALETRLGRSRKKRPRYQSRVIDIDILLWGDRIISFPDLQVPHPHITERRFVLEPLCEIAPGIIHPVTGRSVKEMLTLCNDGSAVKLYKIML